MASEQTIAHDFDRLLAQYPGFFKELVAYVDDIRKYGTLKQAIAEAEKKLADARSASDEFHAEMKGRHQALQGEHTAKRQDLEAALVARQAEIKSMVDAASKDAAVLKKAARDEADRIIAEGNVARAAVDQRVADAQAAAVAVDADIAAKTEILEGIKTSIKARQGDLNRIEDSIAELRAKIA